MFSYCSSLSPLFNVDIFCPYARIDISCLTLNIALKIFICFMNLYQHYLELEFGSQRSMRKCSKRERENGHQTLIQRGHSVKRTCPF